MKYKNGDSYFGEWKANKAFGYGKYETAFDKGFYEGQWKYDMPEGHGTECVKDLYTYEGPFTNGIKNGYGKI